MAARAQLFPKAGYWFLGYLALAILAFWPSYFKFLPYGPEAVVHLHIAGVLVWMALLISQPFLVVRGKWKLHRTIGKSSYLLAPYIVVTSTLLAHSRFAAMDEASFARDGHSLYLPFIAIVLFVACYALAMVHRKKAWLHSRYMIGTALPLVDPIMARLLIFYTPVPPGPILYPLIGYGLTDLVLLALIWADRGQKKGREAFLILLAIFVTAHIGWFTLAQTEAWFRFSDWFRGLPLT
jgi:hypothetical protein